MRIGAFQTWLIEQTYSTKSAKDCTSKCKRVERVLQVDLDTEYKKDCGKAVISHLSYSDRDKKQFASIVEEFSFKPNVNICFRFTDLRSAVNKYFSFCKAGDATINTHSSAL